MIKVIIERHIADGMQTNYEQIAGQILQKSMQARGFITGEALKNTDDLNHRLVIATWRSIADWQQWTHSEERKEMMESIGPILEHEEKITIFEH